MQSQQEISTIIMDSFLIHYTSHYTSLYAKRQDKFTSQNRQTVLMFRGMALSYNLLKVR